MIVTDPPRSLIKTISPFLCFWRGLHIVSSFLPAFNLLFRLGFYYYYYYRLLCKLLNESSQLYLRKRDPPNAGVEEGKKEVESAKWTHLTGTRRRGGEGRGQVRLKSGNGTGQLLFYSPRSWSWSSDNRSAATRKWVADLSATFCCVY